MNKNQPYRVFLLLGTIIMLIFSQDIFSQNVSLTVGYQYTEEMVIVPAIKSNDAATMYYNNEYQQKTRNVADSIYNSQVQQPIENQMPIRSIKEQLERFKLYFFTLRMLIINL